MNNVKCVTVCRHGCYRLCAHTLHVAISAFEPEASACLSVKSVLMMASVLLRVRELLEDGPFGDINLCDLPAGDAATTTPAAIITAVAPWTSRRLCAACGPSATISLMLRLSGLQYSMCSVQVRQDSEQMDQRS
jgi:hypothetical protein